MSYKIDLSGDLPQIKSLEKQIVFAAKQAVISVAQESIPAIVRELHQLFTIRTTWYEPNRKYGIHVRFDKRNREDLSAQIETLADWLEEFETDGTKTTDRHAGRITIAHDARTGGFGSSGLIPGKNKARKILPNASELSTRRLVKATGKKRPRFTPLPFFLNEAGTAIFERLPGKKLKLWYTLATEVHVKTNHPITEPTKHTVELRFGPLFDQKLTEALKSAK